MSASNSGQKVSFIGGGNMAYALVRGLIEQTGSPAIVVSDPVVQQLEKFSGLSDQLTVTTDNREAVIGADAVVLAVKPQVARQAVQAMAGDLRPDQLLISIAAGIPIASLTKWLGREQPVVRCMPNTPALLGAGITGIVGNAATTPMQKDLAEHLLGAAGRVLRFDDEAELDAVTAVSGSGPAYFFYLLEAMIEAGVELGLKKSAATDLTIATAFGAARMAMESGDDPTTLRQQVTSPGGTTERALSILDDGAVDAKVRAAIRGAWRRSQELAQEFD